MSDPGLWALPLALAGGALRAATPYLFVSLGECLTEKSGRINVGVEGILLVGAMSAFGAAWATGSPWAGIAAAAAAGAAMGALHGALCSLARVSHVAAGVAILVLGTGIAFFAGKPFIEPQAPTLPAIELGAWSSHPAVASALRLNPLLALGVVLAFGMRAAFRRARVGLAVIAVGDDAAAATAMGLHVDRTRLAATTLGGALAGIGGASLSLFHPTGWSEAISGGQGLMAMALVIFARWDPVRCLGAALLFGAAGALAPALQAAGHGHAWQLLHLAPHALTLAILVTGTTRARAMRGLPGELAVLR
ncbi:MAG: ABC transporter permease [Burkholderiales bacterium]|jgi:simple sugar transport system permease protein|nr:ABC transporter permease [Burkholderiales bacterium]